MLLFSQLPAGHVVVIVLNHSEVGSVAEVFFKLSDVPARSSQPSKNGRIFCERIYVSHPDPFFLDGVVARRGALHANAVVKAHDPRARSLFPVDDETFRYEVGNLRPALTAGRDFLDLIAKESSVQSVKEEANRLVELLEIRLDKVGVESDLVSLLTDDVSNFAVRAKFRLTGPCPPEALPEGDGLEVVVTARVYRKLEFNGLPSVPDAEGPEVKRFAQVNEWESVDLELPPMPVREGGYFVVAEVRSSDSRYRRNFDPTSRLMRLLDFGFGRVDHHQIKS